MAKPLDDLEMYELFVALYPERFDKPESDELWDEVEEFWKDFEPLDLRSLIGRIVMLSPQLQSPLSGKMKHALGVLDGQAFIAVVSRDAE